MLYPGLVASLGADGYGFAAEWLGRLEERLLDQAPPDRNRDPA